MSQVIDRKVVEMEFDNSKFDSNVKESMSTLDKLKKELDLEGAGEGFKKISNAAKEVSFDGLSKGIDEVKVHFSALETAAMTAMMNITNRAVDAGINMAKSLSIDQVADGWNQYANKTTAVQTIMNATGQGIDSVNASLDKLIWFADETSYSFGDMVDNVGKFTAVGVDLDTASKAMMGISNWAAVSGQNAQTATRAMYNLSQAMGLGYVGLTDWKSIELANMATSEFKQQVIDTAVAMGKLNEGAVTTQNFRESLKDKWFDNDVLLEVLGHYGDYAELVYNRVSDTGELCAEAMRNVAADMGGSYDTIGEKAFRAAQEAKTFTEAIDATKEAVKSQWATLFESVFGNYEEAKVTFTSMANSLWSVFAEPLSDFNDTVSEAMAPPEIDIHEWTDLITEMKSTLGLSADDFNDFERVLAQVARDSGIDIDKMIEAHGNFAGTIEEGWLNTDIIQEAYNRIINGAEGVVDATATLEEFQNVVNRVWAGEFGSGQERRNKLAEMGYDPDEIQRLVDLGYGFELTLEDIGDMTGNLVGLYGTDLTNALKNGAAGVESLQKILNTMSGADLRNGIWDNLFHYEPENDKYGALVTYVYAIRDAFQSVFGTLDSGAIHDALAKIYEWTLKLLDEDRVQKFKTAVENVFHGIHAGITVLKGAFNVVKAVFDNTLGPLLSGLFEIIKSIASGIGGLFVRLDEGAGSLTIFSDAVSWLNENLAPVKLVIEAVTSAIADFISSLFDGKSFLISFKDAVDGAIDAIFGKNSEGWHKKLAFEDFLVKLIVIKDKVVETFDTLGEVITNFWKAFQNTEVGQFISGLVEKIKNALTSAWEAVKKWVNGVFGGNDPEFDLFSGIQGGITSFNDWLKNLNPEDIAQSISDFFVRVKNKVTSVYQSVVDWFKNNEFFSTVGAFISEKFQSLKDALGIGQEDDAEVAKEPFVTRVLNGLKTALEWFKENLPSIIETISTMLKGGALLSLIMLIKQIKDTFSGNKSIHVGIANFFNSLGTALRGFAFKQFASGLMMLAIGLAAVTAVIGAVAYYVPANKVLAVAAAISVLAAGLGVLAIGIAKLKQATALGGLLDSEAGINNAKAGFINGKTGILTSIQGFIGTLGTSLANLADGASKAMKYKGIGVMLVGLAAAMAVLAAGVYALSTIDTDSLIRGLVAVIALIAALTIAMKALISGTNNSFSLGFTKSGGFGLNSKSIGTMSNGFGFIGMAVAILIFVQVINQITQYSFTDILKGVVAVGAIMLEMSAAMRIAGGKFKASTGLGAIMVAASMLLFVKAIDKIRGFNYSDILKGVVSIGAILLELGLAMRLAGSGMKIGNGISAILVAEAIVVLTDAMNKLAALSWSEILKGAGAITALMLALGVGGILFSAANRISDLSGVLKGLGMVLLGVAASIAAVAYAINHDIDLTQVGQGISAFAVSLVQGFVDAITGSADAIIGGFLELLQTLLKYTPQLVDVLISLFIAVLNGLSARMPELADACATFCKALIDNFGRAFEGVDLSGLKSALETLLKTTVVLTLVGKFGGLMSALNGILAFAAVIAAVGGIMLGIGALVDTFDFSLSEKIGKAVDVMKTIGTGIGSFLGALVGSFIGTAIETFTDSLPAVADNLSLFLEKLQPFIDGCSAIDDDFSKSVSRLVAGMAQITGGSFLNSITDFFSTLMNGSDYDSTKEYLEDFGDVADALVSFNEKIKDVSWTNVDGATAAAGVLTALIDAVPETGGTLQDFLGYKNLADSGVNFTMLGLGVKNFCNAIGDTRFNADTAKAAAGAINALLENYPDTGGTLQEFLGYKNLAEANVNFTSLGQGVKNFCDAIGDTTFNVETATAAAGVINTLIQNYPDTGGTLQKFLGYKNLSEANVNFKALGEGVSNFCEAIGDDASFNVQTATDATGIIGTLIKNYPETGGTWQKFAGYKNLAEASINFKSLGEGIKSFADAIGSDTTFNVDTATSATEVISALIENYPSTGGVWQDLTGYKELSDADINFKALGEGVRDFCNAIDGVTFEKQTAIDAAGILSYLIENVPTTGGLWQDIVGEKDLGNFGTNLGILGTGIAGFMDGTDGITEDDLTSAESAAKGMIRIFNLTWPTTGGLWGWLKGAIGGGIDFDDLSTKLDTIGEMAQSLVTNLSTVSEQDMLDAETAANGIIKIFGLSWPKTSGLKGFVKNMFEGGETDWGAITTMGSTIQQFCDSIADISIENIELATTASGYIIALSGMPWPTEPGLFASLDQWLYGGAVDWVSLKSDITNMGEAIGSFCESINGISTDYLTDAVVAASYIIELSKMDWPQDPGAIANVNQWLYGGKVVWSSLKNDVTDMGEAIGNFCSSIADITTDKLQSAITASAYIISLLGMDWPTDPGIIASIDAWFNGSEDIVNWGSLEGNIETMAKAIKAFCDETNGIDDAYVSPAMTAANAIITLLGLDWPTQQGLWQGFVSLFAGSDAPDWGAMESSLPSMGRAIKGFADSVDGISLSASLNASICAAAVRYMMESFPVGDETRAKNMLDFSNYLPLLADAISEYTTTMAEVNVLQLGIATTALANLGTVLGSFSDEDFTGATDFVTSLGTIADSGIDAFTTAFTDSTETVKTDVTTFLSDIKTAIDDTQTDFTTAGEGSFDAYQSGFEEETRLTSLKEAASGAASDAAGAMDSETDFTTSGSNDLGYFQSGFINEIVIQSLIAAAQRIAQQLPSNMENEPGFSRAGGMSIVSYERGLMSNVSSLVNNVGDIASRTANVFGSYQQSFYVSGWNCMVGIINGLADLAPTLYEHARIYGEGAVTSFNNGAGVASPSWKFAQSARYCIQGAVRGFEKNAYLLNEAAEETGQSSVDIMKDIMSGLNFENMDDTLTIRPVLDLSNIQNGASQINEMLDTGSAIGLDAIEAQRLANNINKLNMDAAEINGVYDDSNVIAIITDLGDKIDNLNAAINNIKLYINGQTLVGGIVNDMDKALGSLSSKKNAGVL